MVHFTRPDGSVRRGESQCVGRQRILWQVLVLSTRTSTVSTGTLQQFPIVNPIVRVVFVNKYFVNTEVKS